jgi:hypothetical protein
MQNRLSLHKGYAEQAILAQVNAIWYCWWGYIGLCCICLCLCLVGHIRYQARVWLCCTCEIKHQHFIKHLILSASSFAPPSCSSQNSTRQWWQWLPPPPPSLVVQPRQRAPSCHAWTARWPVTTRQWMVRGAGLAMVATLHTQCLFFAASTTCSSDTMPLLQTQ